MSVIIMLTYRAKAGEADAVAALHRDWRRQQRTHIAGYLSGELLSRTRDPLMFVSIERYDGEAAYQAAASNPEQAAWYRQLLQLIEAEPVATAWRSDWRAEPGPSGGSDAG